MEILVNTLIFIASVWGAGFALVFLWVSQGNWRNWRDNLLLAIGWPIILAFALGGGIRIQ